jgi:hypothetical protein
VEDGRGRREQRFHHFHGVGLKFEGEEDDDKALEKSTHADCEKRTWKGEKLGIFRE